MESKLSKILKDTILYISMFMAYALLSLSIFINYKQQIVDEHIQFLQTQIPNLHSKNLFILKEINIESKYRISVKKTFKKFEPFLTYLTDATNKITEDDLIIINDFLMEELKAPNMLLDFDFDKLSASSREKLMSYRIKSFQNKLIVYLYQSEIGYKTCIAPIGNWSLLDFWSKDNYHIYLSYMPTESYETSMTINGSERNENAILFGPKRTGIHTFDISLSHFDEQGMEKKLKFTKEINVLP